MSSTNPNVDPYFRDARRRQGELQELRRIVLACGLTEELKWRAPCYTVDGRNIVLIGALKEFCTLSFFKGALLKDAQGLLERPGPNTQAARIVKFTDVRDIVKQEAVLKAYVREAVVAERAGLKVETKPDAQPELPAELVAKFDESPPLRKAFNALTPGRQRAYLMHFAAAKQSKTRTARIDKYAARILAGKGIHDCVCGHTRKPPGCDGSHKNYQ